MRPRLALAILGAALATGAAAPPVLPGDHTNLDWKVQYDVHPDLTFTEVWQEDWSLNTARGVALLSRPSWSFWPDSETFKVEEAWVTQPDGTRLEVPAANIFTRPSAAAQNAPGFVTSQTVTIEYPQLMPGSHWHVKWRRDRTKPPLAGFNVAMSPVAGSATGPIDVEISAPDSVAIAIATRGAFTTSDSHADGIRHITGHADPMKARPAERGMVADTDVAPLFAATTMPSLAAYGALLHRAMAGRDAVTPEIAAKAQQIRGGLTGLAAARAISDWVAGHIRYVAVYLNPADGLVPHPAAEVLHNGFGDCKDHVALMQALLSASGVRSEPAIVDWGNRYRQLPLPLPNQFNHEMIYLPDFGVFTNPTSPFSRFGVLEAGLAGKTVVIASAQGAVGRTPDSDAADNRYQQDSAIALLPDGTVTGTAHIAVFGGLETSFRSVIANAASRDDLVETNLAETPEGGVGRLKATDPRDLETPLDLQASWTSNRAVPVQDGDVFLTVPIGFDMEQPAAIRRTLSGRLTRSTPLVMSAKDLTWKTTLTIPATLSPRRLPPDQAVTNQAGSFSSVYQRTETGLTVTRHLRLNRDVTPPEDYAALQALIYSAAEDARGVVVLTPRPS